MGENGKQLAEAVSGIAEPDPVLMYWPVVIHIYYKDATIPCLVRTNMKHRHLYYI